MTKGPEAKDHAQILLLFVWSLKRHCSLLPSWPLDHILHPDGWQSKGPLQESMAASQQHLFKDNLLTLF